MISTEYDAANPIEIRDYPVAGMTQRPILDGGTNSAITFLNDPGGGVRIWNLEVRGDASVDGTIHVYSDAHDIDICNVRTVGGYCGMNIAPFGTYVTNIRIRKNTMVNGAFTGFIGGSPGISITENVFSNNGTLANSQMHSAYLVADPGHEAPDGAVPNTVTFSNNTLEAGSYCAGTLLVVHGVWIQNHLVIENNLISTTSTIDGCYGIMISGGNSGAELHNTVVRRNRVLMQTEGQSAIEVDCCQDCTVSDNITVNGQLAIANASCNANYMGSRGTYQNNTLYNANMVIGTYGTGPHQADSNAVWRTGGTCYGFNGTMGRSSNNYCRTSGQPASAVFVDAPNGNFRPAAGSPLIGYGSSTNYSPIAIGTDAWSATDQGVTRSAPIDSGAMVH